MAFGALAQVGRYPVMRNLQRREGMHGVIVARRREYRSIQALRFFAAFLVVVTHATFYTGNRLDPRVHEWSYGGVGVDIFFVISGFVMVVSSRSRWGRRDAWRHFLTRRVIRIVPMYWIATLVVLFVAYAVPSVTFTGELTAATIIGSFFFLPVRQSTGRVEPILGVGWTLTFEVMFYAAFTLGLLLVRRYVVCFVTAVMGVLTLLYFVRGHEWSTWEYYFDSIVMYFVIGMLIAVAEGSKRSARILEWMIAVFLAWWAIAFAVNGGRFSFVSHDPQRFALVCVLVIGAVRLEGLVGPRIPSWLMLGGGASYAIYLFHPIFAPGVPFVFAKLHFDHAYVSIAGSVLVSVVVGVAIYKLVESPLVARLRRLTKFG